MAEERVQNSYNRCVDQSCYCNWGGEKTMTNGYVTVKGLPPIAPHTNPAYDDTISMYTTAGQSNECYIMYQDHWDMDTEYQRRNKGHIKRMVLYHTPTGTKIEITIDLEWLNDPAYDRDKAELRETKSTTKGRNPEVL